MTLAKTLRQNLNDPNQGIDSPVTASAGDWTANAHAPHRDKVGAEFDELTVQRSAPGPGSVKSWADRFSGSNTGLLEPLKVQEVDAVQDDALIRSSPPHRTDAGVDYYEVRMHGTEKASVKRYRAGDAGRRESIPFTLTHDGVEKLVDSLTGSQG